MKSIYVRQLRKQFEYLIHFLNKCNFNFGEAFLVLLAKLI